MSRRDRRDVTGQDPLTRRMIRRDGWTIQSVDAVPPYYYTLGLTEKRLPELYVKGPPLSMATLILHDLAGQHVEDQLKPGTLYQIPGITAFAGWRVVKMGMPHQLTVARNMYAGRLTVLQVLAVANVLDLP